MFRKADPDQKGGPSDGQPKERKFASQLEGEIGKKPLNNYVTTLVHLIKGYVGTGIFAMGLAMKDAGIIPGIILLWIIALINLHCQHILIKCAVKIASLEEEEVKPSYSEVVEYTMEESSLKYWSRNAHRFGFVSLLLLFLSEVGFCCVYFVFIEEHLLKIFDSHDILDENNPLNKHLILAVIFFPMWLSTFLSNLKMLMPLSLTANVLMCSGVGIVLYFTTQGLPHIGERDMVAHIRTWPLFFGLVIFAFEGITFIIPMRNEMKKPEQFVSHFGVLNVGMTTVCSLYFLVGFLGYWKYGEEIEGSVFLNIMDKDNPIMTDVIYSIMCIAILFTFTIHMYIPVEITFPLLYRKYKWKRPYVAVTIYRLLLVVTIYFMANVIPFLGLFIGLIGASGGALLAFIIPAMLDLIAFANTKLLIAKDWAIIVLGIFGAITGTALTIKEIVETFISEYGNHNTTESN